MDTESKIVISVVVAVLIFLIFVCSAGLYIEVKKLDIESEKVAVMKDAVKSGVSLNVDFSNGEK